MSMLNVTGTKACTGCDKVLPLTGYRADPRASDRRQSRCRECERNYAAAYYDGLRARDLVTRTDRAQSGPFVCIDPIARLRSDNKTCRNCGYPVVARMAPDLQARMEAKRPAFADQTVVPYERLPVAS